MLFSEIILYAMGIFAFIQLLYLFAFYFRIPFHKIRKEIDFDFQKPVSVIIAAHNELENLKKLLPILYRQNYPEFEIIVVNDRSQDETEFFLREEQRKEPRLRVLHIERTPPHISHKKYALTLAIRAASYEHLLFTDADCLPSSEHWIALMAQEFSKNKQIVLGVSPYKKEKGFLNWLIRYETFFTAIQYISYALVRMPYMGVGRNLAYTKTLFLENKGFHKHLKIVGGDDDLFVNANANAHNTGVCIHPQAQVFSLPKRTWGAWFRQKKRHLSVGKYYRKKHQFFLALQNGSHVLFWLAFTLFVIFFPWQKNIWEWQATSLLALAGCRLIFWSLAQYLNAKNLYFACSYLSWCLYDVLYVFFIMFIGIKSYFSKPEQWI
ncbi:MAG: glycosyltransferase [Raineya sp.]|nr:glycosyltransferase [Raineya sp.]